MLSWISTLFFVYLFYQYLNNLQSSYYTNCGIQGTWVFENIGNREEIITNIMADIRQCRNWRMDVIDRWGGFDFNTTHRVCVVDFSNPIKALELLNNCNIGQIEN